MSGQTRELDGSGLGLDPDCELFLKGDPSFHSYSAVTKGWIPFSFAALAAASQMAFNFTNKRPIQSGAHRYATGIIGGIILGLYVNDFKNKYLVEKDLQYYHYMTLHPDDFKAPEKVKYKNYLSHWHPYR